MRAFLYGVAVLFVVFAALQSNDAAQYATADPVVFLWIFAYGLASFSTLRAARGKAFSRVFHVSFMCMAVILAVVRCFSIDYSHSLIFCHECNPAANEAGGLLILAVWNAFMAFRVCGRMKESSFTG